MSTNVGKWTCYCFLHSMTYLHFLDFSQIPSQHLGRRNFVLNSHVQNPRSLRIQPLQAIFIDFMKVNFEDHDDGHDMARDASADASRAPGTFFISYFLFFKTINNLFYS
jgi:hypothetical protein